MKSALIFFTIIFSACFSSLQAQQADSVLIKKNKLTLDSLNEFFTYEDSLSIFNLIDSLLKTDTNDLKEKSMMAIRLGYNSNIIADNSTFNVSQFGLAPGISYYHKSGAYADFTAYWSREYEPNFYLSVASIGYLHTVNKWYAIIGEYNHYFYSQNDNGISAPYTENIGITNYFEVGKAILRLDYYFYFGERTAHRILPNIGFNFKKKKFLGFDKISVYPNANVLFGSETITQEKLLPNPVLRFIYNRNHPNEPQLPYTYFDNKTEFGVMNYALSLPITFSKNDWSVLLGYNYNFPRSLSDEYTSLQNGGYLSFSITRYIGF